MRSRWHSVSQKTDREEGCPGTLSHREGTRSTRWCSERGGEIDCEREIKAGPWGFCVLPQRFGLDFIGGEEPIREGRQYQKLHPLRKSIQAPWPRILTAQGGAVGDIRQNGRVLLN